MRMSLNVQEAQRNGVAEMLRLTPSSTSSSTSSEAFRNSRGQNDKLAGNRHVWKVLIYDQACQSILAPLVKVGSLRQHGVTLHLMITAERSPVPEAPAVYFVEPTKENVAAILRDMSLGLYSKFHINFSSVISPNLLEEFAKASVVSNTSRLVAAIVDRYLHFVSVSPSEFLLECPGAFTTLHRLGSDERIKLLLQKIVDGLFSVIVCMGIIPVIRCPKSPASPAHLIGTQLHERMKQELSQRSGSGAAVSPLLLNASGPGGAGGLSSLQRPALILLDREIDFSVMLHHTWSYEALIRDLLTLKLNRVSVPMSTPGDASGDKTKMKFYDLDSADPFWVQYASKSFPEAAVAISEALGDYNARMAALGHHNTTGDLVDGTDGGAAAGLASAINSVPELTEKKRSIDVHTNIATALVTEIKGRGLDRYYELEDQFESSSLTAGVSLLEKLIGLEEKGSSTDKTRAALCFYLSKQQLPPQQVDTLKSMVKAAGGSTAALEFLQRLETFRTMQKQLGLSKSSGATTAVTSAFPNVAGAQAAVAWGATFFDKGKGLLQGVKNLLPIKRNLPITKMVDDLLELRQNELTESCLYLDPKSAQLGVPDAAMPRLRSPFRQGIVFVVGGGSCAESHALKELAQQGMKQIIYGSTDFVPPSDFLKEMEVLGSEITDRL